MAAGPATTVALAAVLAIASPMARGAACGGAGVTAETTRSAAAAVRLHVTRAHVGSVGGLSPEVDARLSTVAADDRIRTQAQLAYALNRAIAPLADAHLEVRLRDEAARQCRYLPVRFGWNATGLWVDAGDATLPPGARIERLGRLSVADIEARLAGILPHETTQWLRFHGAALLSREDLLGVLGVIDRSGRVPVQFRTPAGRRERRLVAPGAMPPAARPWVGYRIYGAERTGLFWFDRFDYVEDLAAAFDRFLQDAARAGVDKIAIDVRGNPGGDSGVAVAMLDALTTGKYSAFAVEVRPSPELAAGMPILMPESMNGLYAQLGLPPIAPDAATYTLAPPLVLGQLRSRVAARPLTARLDGRKLFLLTDGGSFSSATLFAGLARDNRLATIVGEAAGNPASFNGTELHLDLPGIDYYLNLSAARLWRPDTGAPPAAEIAPDIPAVRSAADAAAGTDPALDVVLRQ